MALRGEIQPRPHVATGRGDAGGVPRVEAVDAVALALLRLDVPLQVAPYLPQQRPADALRYGELLHARHACERKDFVALQDYYGSGLYRA